MINEIRIILSCHGTCIRRRKAWHPKPLKYSRIKRVVVHLPVSDMLQSGPGSSVGIATDLRAGRSGIESRWGRDFPPVQTGPGAQPASCKMGTGSFPGGKVRPGRAADHSPPYSAAVMEE